MHYANKGISHVKSLTFYRDELWKDMFCRLVEDEAMPYHATAIQRWMQEELQIKGGFPIEIKIEIRYLIIGCDHIFMR